MVVDAVHITEFSVPQSECVGWYKWTQATTAVHKLRNAWCATQSAEYQSLIWYKEKVMHMHTASREEGEPNSPPTHMLVAEVPAVRKENPTALPYTYWLLRWWVAREHLKVVGCFQRDLHTLSPDYTWQCVRVAGQ